MARGIEELAEMQVTGPVQGGDMVAKPNEMPTGAAALLNKMSRQNTPGIFKLPMPDKQMPDFMKVAAEGVEQQTAKGDTINQMAGELLRQGVNIQGMGMDEIIQIYEQTFGSPGDVDEFGVSQVDPSDWRSILKMIEAGMSQDEIEAQIAATKFPGNFTQEKQNIVELPRNLKTAPDAEETKLAYITDDEKAILALMNPGTPHEGPEGVPSYDSIDYDKSGNVYVTTGEQASAMEAVERGDAGKQQKKEVKQMSKAHKDVYEKGGYGEDYASQTDAQKEAAGRDAVTQATEKKDDTMLDKTLNVLGRPFGSFMAAGDFISDTFANLEEWQVKKLLEGSVKDTGTGMGSLLYELGGPNSPRFKDWFKKRGDIFDESFEGEKTKGGDPVASLSDEEKFQFLVDKYTGNKQFDKTYTPKDFYGSKPGESNAEYQNRMRKKGVTAKELADMQMQGKLGYTDPETGRWNTGITRGMTMMIEEGRQRLAEDRKSGRGDQDKYLGPGGPGEKITKEEEVVTTTDPRAGAWNVGGTMPYTEDIRTAAVETDVPLGRRFGIDKAGKYAPTGRDLSKAMEYATLGGYGQLEPFQEYLTRRREYLGEDEPRYFDEDGNVIYSETT
jgi:hypothetical protein